MRRPSPWIFSVIDERVTGVTAFVRRCRRLRDIRSLDLHRPVCWSTRDCRFSSPFRSLRVLLGAAMPRCRGAAWTRNTETTRDTLYSASALRYLVARNAAILLHIRPFAVPSYPGPLFRGRFHWFPLHVGHRVKGRSARFQNKIRWLDFFCKCSLFETRRHNVVPKDRVRAYVNK